MANIVNATNIKLYYGAAMTLIANCTNAQLSVSVEMMGATTKDSAGWDESIPGKRSWTMTGDFYYERVPGEGAIALSTLYDAAIARTKFKIFFSQKVASTEQFSGDCYIESVDMSAGVEENVSFSLTLKGTGSLTRNTYSGVGE